MAEIACEIRHSLDDLPPGALVVAAPLPAEPSVKNPAGLTARLSNVVAGALGARASDEAAKLARARTLASDAGTLVHLTPNLSHGDLQVAVDVYRVPKSFWDRVRDPEPSPSQHTFARRKLDAELRTFLPPVPLVAQHIDKAPTSEPDPVAVACGDANGDGAQEIVLVGRHRIQLGRIRSGRLLSSTTRSWTELSPLSRAPLREPIASAVIREPGTVDVGLSDRLDGVRMQGDLVLTGKLGRRLPWAGGGCARVVGLSVRPEIEACTDGDAAPEVARMAGPADALAGARVVQPNGSTRLIRAERSFNSSSVVVTDDRGKSARVEGVGAQLAVGDPDGDGRPEILWGANTLTPGGDALIVSTWQDDGRVTERLRVGVPTGVRAIAVCDAEDTGMAPIVVATRGAVWLVR